MVFFETDAKLLKKAFGLEVKFKGDEQNVYSGKAQNNENLKFEPIIEGNELWIFDSYVFRNGETDNIKICFTNPLFISVHKKEMLLETDVCSMGSNLLDVENKYYFKKKDIGWIRIDEKSDIAKDLWGDYEAYEIAELI